MIFNKIKSFTSYCFKVQPVVTTFAVTFFPLYFSFIYPTKKELTKKAIKIENLNNEWLKYHQKWDDFNGYTEQSLEEKGYDLNLLEQLGIETFGNDISFTGADNIPEPIPEF